MSRNPIAPPPIGEYITFSRTIIAGDFDAKCPDWGYTEMNASGRYIEDGCISTNLIRLQNADSEPTLLHTGYSWCPTQI